MLNHKRPVAVVTDGTSDLPSDIAQAKNITVVPLNVHFGDQTYQAPGDLTTDEFFRRLSESRDPPTTSQPSVGQFVEAYTRLCQSHEAIVSVHISSKLSGTYGSAQMASQDMRERCRVEVVDSLWATMGLGCLAMVAADAANEGKNADEVVADVQKAIPRMRILLFVETLEYLRKGGRIGKAQAFLGSLLNVKPLLSLSGGEIVPVEKVRTRGRAIMRLAEFAREQGAIEMLSVLYSTTPEDVEAFLANIGDAVQRDQVIVAKYGPAIGTHIGPGAMGAVLLLK